MKLEFIKKKIVYIPAIAVIVIIALAYGLSGKKATPITAVAKLENLVQEVSVSGTVKAKEAVELGFEKGGIIGRINVEVGDRIEAGTLLLSLSNWSELTSVDDAKAKLDSKQAHYDDLKKGGTAEEIRVKEAGLAKAKSDLATDYSAVSNIILDGYNKADNAVHRQADLLFSNPLSANPQLSFNSSDQQASIDAEAGRYNVELVLSNFKTLIQTPPVANLEIENSLTAVKNYLLSVNDFLIKTSKSLNSALNLSDSTLATNKDALNTARTNINTALTNVNDQIQTITTQKITVETASNELELTKAPASPEVLAGAMADIRSADAVYKNAEATLLKTYIYTPIAGVVTKQDAKVGEIASAGATLVAVMSDNFKVETFVPEVDVAKIAVGNPATITLDAYGSGVEFMGTVVKIDPAETIIDGVSTYKTTLEFTQKDSRVRSGMTANITIQSARRENVVALPQRAVYGKGNKKFVSVMVSKNNLEGREVTLGIRGSNGDIEIVSGLKEGEIVLMNGK